MKIIFNSVFHSLGECFIFCYIHFTFTDKDLCVCVRVNMGSETY